MSFNPYMYEQLIAARHEEILRDVQQSNIRVHTRQRRSPERSSASRPNLLGSQPRVLRQSGASAL